MKRILSVLLLALCIISCKEQNKEAPKLAAADFKEVQTGGVKMIPVKTPAGDFKVGPRNSVTVQP